ncbi:MAG: hypothetical protein IT331_13495 [Anaerolineae bacterium]|nr:hypothetical protein [Anaerolineae bacterium]
MIQFLTDQRGTAAFENLIWVSLLLFIFIAIFALVFGELEQLVQRQPFE